MQTFKKQSHSITTTRLKFNFEHFYSKIGIVISSENVTSNDEGLYVFDFDVLNRSLIIHTYGNNNQYENSRILHYLFLTHNFIITDQSLEFLTLESLYDTKIINATIGDSIEFVARYEGFPPPVAKWYFYLIQLKN